MQKNSIAVRVTHIPTGTVVTAERAQPVSKPPIRHALLRGKLYDMELQKREEQMERLKGKQVEMGWGNQIRSYVLQPYQMVKDLRTEYEVAIPKPYSTATWRDSWRPGQSQGPGNRHTRQLNPAPPRQNAPARFRRGICVMKRRNAALNLSAPPGVGTGYVPVTWIVKADICPPLVWLAIGPCGALVQTERWAAGLAASTSGLVNAWPDLDSPR